MQMIPYTLLLFFLISCSNVENTQMKLTESVPTKTLNYPESEDHAFNSNPYGSVGSIPLPAGFKRSGAPSGSYAAYLRNIELKSDKTVYLYNGTKKRYQGAQFAVLNISVQNRDLQQCADAVMRLRAEYFYGKKQFEKILFVDNEAGEYRFKPPYTRANFDKYLLQVFGMCGSASLSKQMKLQSWSNLQIGDVLIKGGFPGHAVSIMDMAENGAGKKIYLLSQSYMPAQDIHILVNKNNSKLSPWYEVSADEVISTPEWNFYKNQLKTW